MKKIFLIKLLIISFLVAGCSFSKKEVTQEPKSQQTNINLPQWILDPKIPDAIAAVGIASPSRGGIKFQIPQAELDAKANIATFLQSEISRATKTALRESNLNDVNDIEKFFSEATTNIIKNVKLSGAERVNIFRDNDGTLYIHMAIKGNDYSKILKESQKLFQESLHNSNLSSDNIDKSQKAVEKLFEELK